MEDNSLVFVDVVSLNFIRLLSGGRPCLSSYVTLTVCSEQRAGTVLPDLIDLLIQVHRKDRDRSRVGKPVLVGGRERFS